MGSSAWDRWHLRRTGGHRAAPVSSGVQHGVVKIHLSDQGYVSLLCGPTTTAGPLIQQALDKRQLPGSPATHQLLAGPDPIGPDQLVAGRLRAGQKLSLAPLPGQGSDLQAFNSQPGPELGPEPGPEPGQEPGPLDKAGLSPRRRLIWGAWLGARLEALEDEPQSPFGRDQLLRLARAGDREGVARQLSKPDARRECGRPGETSPLMAAAFGGHAGVVDELVACGGLDVQDADGTTALILAASSGHLDVVVALLAAGCDPNLADSDRTTALIAAAWEGHSSVLLALIRSDALLDVQDAGGSTALIAAATSGHLTGAMHLVGAGARTELRDLRGDTAETAAMAGGHYDIATVCHHTPAKQLGQETDVQNELEATEAVPGWFGGAHELFSTQVYKRVLSKAGKISSPAAYKQFRVAQREGKSGATASPMIDCKKGIGKADSENEAGHKGARAHRTKKSSKKRAEPRDQDLDPNLVEI